MLSMKPTVLYVPLSELAEHPDLPQRVSVETQLAAILPRVIWSGELAPVARQNGRQLRRAAAAHGL